MTSLLRQSRAGGVLENTTTGLPLASEIEIAGDSRSRRRGLLGRDAMRENHAMLIAPTSAVHTFFMRFRIDVVFVDRGGRVLKAYRALPPWRCAAAWGAYAAIELPAGTVDRTGTVAGHVLAVAPR